MAETCRIRVLPDLLVSKIAAGEVVERPASVVKELLENAIDAGASRISVAIEAGGKQLIRVTDDGCGMSAEELRLCVMPHATSKIDNEDDLYSIATMGFRGEALASISAVSKLRVVSRPKDAEEGSEVRVAGEQVEALHAAGCPVGTSIEVRDLFFNVPARRKFLRGNSTEVGHVNEQFARVALAWPEIGFELSNNQRITQNLARCKTRLERIAKFYGVELGSALLRIDRSERGIDLEAYVAPPAQSRATTQWQYTYVNGRFIRDRFLQHAVKEAYRGLMDADRHGVVFLFLKVDPQQVDVNVHPTKSEVRWADSNLIHSQVLSALRETLHRCDLSPALRTDRARRPGASVDPAEQDRIRKEMAETLKRMTPIQPGAQAASGEVNSLAGAGQTTESGSRHVPSPTGQRDSARAAEHGALPNAEQIWQSLYGTPASSDTAPQAAPGAGDLHDPGREGVQSLGTSSGEPVGQPPARPPHGAVRRPRAIQLHNLYLVAETDDGIVIVDQHALHERIMYEQLRERFARGPLESQRLLLPETMKLAPRDVTLIETHAELLHGLGIEVTPFGRDSIAIHAFPSLLRDADVISFMRDLLDGLAQHSVTTPREAVIHGILDMMACKAAVKAGDPLTDEEIDALMRQRHLIERSSSCPHGRPTMLRLTRADLDRQFKRT
ncbi:MAG: DNA mismatch repair endonuclease MutL [Phycisphaerae bacterium]